MGHEIAQAVNRYARGFAATSGTEHSATSPLGAWLLAALVAPMASGGGREVLERVLGMPATDAAAVARTLLTQPSPVVRAGAGCWTRPTARTPAVQAWAVGLPAGVNLGGLPSEAEADAWALRCTGDLIDHFPVRAQAETDILLATALASDVTWRYPLHEVPAQALGGRFGGGVGRWALAASGADRVELVETSRGMVGVHAVDAEGGMRVVSVIAVDPHASSNDVHQACAEVVSLLGGYPEPVAAIVDPRSLPAMERDVVSLADVPRVGHSSPDGCCRSAVLPAWSATSDADLGRDEAMSAAGAALVAALPASRRDGAAVTARQTAMARFSRSGFQAAAVTALGVAGAGMPPQPTVVRALDLRFNRPFAVAAVVMHPGPWEGLVAFSAWVGQADDAVEPPGAAGAVRP